MAKIKVNDIKPAGAQLFNDSESFLKEVTEEFVYIRGGHDSPGHTVACDHCPKPN